MRLKSSVRFLAVVMAATAASHPKAAKAVKCNDGDNYFVTDFNARGNNDGNNLHKGWVYEVIHGKPLSMTGLISSKRDTLDERKAVFDSLVRTLERDQTPVPGSEAPSHWTEEDDRHECIELKLNDINHAIQGVSKNTLSDDPQRDQMLEYMVTKAVGTSDTDVSAAIFQESQSDMRVPGSDVSETVQKGIMEKANETWRENKLHTMTLRKEHLSRQIAELKLQQEYLKLAKDFVKIEFDRGAHNDGMSNAEDIMTAVPDLKIDRRMR